MVTFSLQKAEALLQNATPAIAEKHLTPGRNWGFPACDFHFVLCYNTKKSISEPMC